MTTDPDKILEIFLKIIRDNPGHENDKGWYWKKLDKALEAEDE
jgi:hypothetical protein